MQLLNIRHLHVLRLRNSDQYATWLASIPTPSPPEGVETMQIEANLIRPCERADDDPQTHSLDSIGKQLWKKLPPPITKALDGFKEYEHLCLVVHASGQARLLPWEGLCDLTKRPVGRGHWQLVRAVGSWCEEQAPLAHKPRVLLLVGSTQVKEWENLVKQAVLDTLQAIEAQGFACDVAAGVPQFDGLILGASPTRLKVRSVTHACQVLQGHYEIIHFVGPSDAASGFSATELKLEVCGDDGKPRPDKLPLGELAKSVKAGSARLLVLHACKSSDDVAETLLTGNDRLTVVGLRAMAPASVTAPWAKEFYAALADQRSIAAAASRARQALPVRDQWIPVLCARTAAHLPLWAPQAHAIDTYCQALAAYCNALIRRYQIFSESLTLSELDKVYVEVQTAPRADHAAVEVGGTRSTRMEQGERVALPALVVQPRDDANSQQRWIVGGGPGAGKSTLLRRYARLWALESYRRWVPVLVPLYDWRARQDLFEYVLAKYLPQQPDAIKAQVTEALHIRAAHGGLILLFDGLDELGQKDLEAFRTWLATLPRAWAACPIVITSRRYGTPLYVGPGFCEASLVELDPTQAADLMHKILSSRPDTKSLADDARQRWLKDFKTGPRFLREFGKVPLFVTLLAVLEKSRAANAPNRVREAVFAAMFKALCLGQHRDQPAPERWLDPMGQLAGLPAAQRQAQLEARVEKCLLVLGYAALEMTKLRRLDATTAEIEAWLRRAPDVVHRALQDLGRSIDTVREWLRDVGRETRVLAPETVVEDDYVLPGSDECQRFWHRHFQEALSARELARRLPQPTVDSLWKEVGEIQPSAPRIQEMREEMRKRWRADYGQFWVDCQDLWAASLPNLGPIRSELNRLNNEIQRLDVAKQDYGALWSQREDLVAEHLAPVLAARAEREYWTETLALLAERLESDALVLALVRRDPELGRRVAESRDRLAPRTALVLLRRLPRLNDRSRLLARLVEQVKAEPLVAVLGRVGAKILNATVRPEDPRGQVELIEATLDRLPESEAVGQVRTRLRQACTQRPLVQDDEAPWLRVATRPKLPLWVPVPAGSFTMGSNAPDPERYGNEGPVEVTIGRPFWISATPITVGLYRLFDQGETILWQGKWQALSALGTDTDTLPMTGVSWYAASMFCRWASTVLLPSMALQLQIDPEQFETRLPTEAEWEYGARAGTTTRYFFGDDATDLEHYAWFGDAQSTPRPVASKYGKPDDRRQGANEFGLFDVHGNVWEWCEDWYGTKLAGGRDPRGPVEPSSSVALRVQRGGSFGYRGRYCRSAKRIRDSPDSQVDNTGFRVVVAARRPRCDAGE